MAAIAVALKAVVEWVGRILGTGKAGSGVQLGGRGNQQAGRDAITNNYFGHSPSDVGEPGPEGKARLARLKAIYEEGLKHASEPRLEKYEPQPNPRELWIADYLEWSARAIDALDRTDALEFKRLMAIPLETTPMREHYRDCTVSIERQLEYLRARIREIRS